MTRLTPKLREALQCAVAAPDHTLVRCAMGFRAAGASPRRPTVTRRTANQLVIAMWADYNDPQLPSRLVLNPRGMAAAVAAGLLPAPMQAAA